MTRERLLPALPIVSRPFYVLMPMAAALITVTMPFRAYPASGIFLFFLLSGLFWVQLLLGQVLLRNHRYTAAMAELQLLGCALFLIPSFLSIPYLTVAPFPFVLMTAFGMLRLQDARINPSYVFVHYAFMFSSVFVFIRLAADGFGALLHKLDEAL